MALPAARLGDLGLPHFGCGVPVVGSGSPKVFVNGIPAARFADKIVPHTINVPNGCAAHTSIIIKGSPKVFINGLPAAYFSSKLLGCTFIIQGSPKVFWGIK